ncbi:hypothetical protein Y1Q_0015193 [Alligator mississippiensis]|uniref:Secreted protein n=1 Tax=Alligator mississippiensis TaxID=8496 RepID=A0A151P944_ALLMI|nr:hypothetical protein Y1Q_0015193 [Alligator mississippiensis]
MVGRGCLVTVSPLAVVAAAVARLLLMPQKNCTPASGGFISFENCIMATNYIIIMHKNCNVSWGTIWDMLSCGPSHQIGIGDIIFPIRMITHRRLTEVF